MSPRSEEDILHDLRTLCSSQGYAYALARLCIENDWVRFSEKSGPDDYSHLYDGNHLTLTEIATLTLLFASQPINLGHPGSECLNEYTASTHSLLRELHESLGQHFIRHARIALEQGDKSAHPPPGAVYREPYFYTAPTAYYHQYRDFARSRYKSDDHWFSSRCGFTIGDCYSVFSELTRLQEKNVTRWFRNRDVSDTSLLECLSFDADEISLLSGIDIQIVTAILDHFVCPPARSVPILSAANDFNIITCRPIIASPDGRYVLFQFYWLFESLYVSPAYWMQRDAAYRDTAARNRGKAAEALSHRMLAKVFGDNRVFANVRVFQGRKQVGEIDVLAVFGDRAVAIEAKAKRLTLDARQGRRAAIERDFSDAIQKAHDQIVRCSTAILRDTTRLRSEDGAEINLPHSLAEVYPVCVLAEHYPALNFQVRHLLEKHQVTTVRMPLVLDVFALDSVTELLSSPLRFINYLDLRAIHGDHFQANTELSLLALHLSQNLWPLTDGGLTYVHDDVDAQVDSAMNARRCGLPCPDIPTGILTVFRGRPIGNILDELAGHDAPAAIELGLMLLKASGPTLQRLDSHFAAVLTRAANERSVRTTFFREPEISVGLTVQCVPFSQLEDDGMLRQSCSAHKYSHRSESWVGVELRADHSVSAVVVLRYPWKRDLLVEQMIRRRRQRVRFVGRSDGQNTRKIGRNDPCPCGSGKKFKRCCAP